MVDKRGLGGLGRSPRAYSETLRSEMAGRFADDVPAAQGKPNAFSDMLLNNWIDRTVGRSQERRGLEMLPPGELQQFQRQDRQNLEDIYQKYRHESGLLRPDAPRSDTPAQLSLQDRLPPGWATEGWPQQRTGPPPSPMARRLLEQEGLPAAIPGGPPAAELEQLTPRTYPQPIGFRPDQVGPYPKTYRNELPPPPLPEAVMPPGWTPPLSLHQRIERGLEAQRQRRSEEPPATRQNPVLRRKKPQRPKARESEA